MDWYMTGTTRCRNADNAQGNVDRYRKPAVVREVEGFHDVTRLSRKPVQPGQRPFAVKDGEKVHYEDRA